MSAEQFDKVKGVVVDVYWGMKNSAKHYMDLAVEKDKEIENEKNNNTYFRLENEELQKEIAELRKPQRDYETEIERLEGENGLLNTQIDNLGKDIKCKESEIIKRQTEFDRFVFIDVEKCINRLIDDKEEKNRIIAGQKEKIFNLETISENKDEKIRQLEGDNGLLKKDIKEKIFDLEGEREDIFSELEEKNEELKEENKTLIGKLDDLERKHKKRCIKYETLHIENRTLDEKTQQLEKENKEFEMEIQELRNTDNAKEVDRLNVEKGKLAHFIELRDLKIRQLDEENESLKMSRI